MIMTVIDDDDNKVDDDVDNNCEGDDSDTDFIIHHLLYNIITSIKVDLT